MTNSVMTKNLIEGLGYTGVKIELQFDPESGEWLSSLNNGKESGHGAETNLINSLRSAYNEMIS